MKQIILVSVLSMLFVTTHAQVGKDSIIAIWQTATQAVLGKQTTTPDAAKTAQIKQRLVAYAYYQFSASPSSLLDTGTFKYNSTAGTLFRFDITHQQFDDRFSTANHDTSFSWQNSGNSLKPDQIDIIHYTATRKKDTIVRQLFDPLQQVFNNYFRLSYQFDAVDNITAFGEETWNKTTGSWEKTESHIYTYSSTNQQITDTYYYYTGGQPVLSQVSTNYYNSAAKIDTTIHQIFSGGTWKIISLFLYSYYPNGLLKESILKFNSYSQGIINADRDSFGYTGGFTFPTYNLHCSWLTTINKWDNSYQFLAFLNSFGLADSIAMIQSYGPLITFGYKYNNYGNPVSAFIYQNPFSAPRQLIGKNFFYYETYNDNLAVQNVAEASPLILYPNPTNASLNIKSEQALPGNIISIWDVTGKKIQEQTLKTGNLNTVYLNDMTPGVYWLTLQGTDGTLWGKQSFIKQK